MAQRPNNPAPSDDGTSALVGAAPESLTDPQLIGACRLVGWERHLSQFAWSGWGCGASVLVAGIATIACAVALSHFVFPTAHWQGLSAVLAPFGLMVAGVLFMSVAEVPGRRRERYWKELQRRYAGAGVGEYVRQIKSEAARTPSLGPDVAVILSGAALPHGGDWLVLVRLFDGGDGTVEMRKLGFGHALGADADRARPEKGQATLSAADCKRVHEALTAFRKTGTKAHFWSTVYDGVPATLTVWERGRGVVAAAKGNLAGVPPRAEGHPAICLMRLAMELGQRVPTKPLIFGTCSFGSGDIRIDAG